jgi:hypothetical protein
MQFFYNAALNAMASPLTLGLLLLGALCLLLVPRVWRSFHYLGPTLALLLCLIGLPAIGGSVFGLPFVLNNAMFGYLSPAQYIAVQRLGVVSLGDASPPLTFTTSTSPCSLNAGAGDGGSQVPMANGGCAFALMMAPADVLQWGAVCNGTTDDSAVLIKAAAWAVANSRELQVRRQCAVGGDLTLGAAFTFWNGGGFTVASTKTLTLTSPVIRAHDTQQIFYGAGAVVASAATRVSIGWWGAVAAANAGTDAMPALRASWGSNRKIVAPPGYTYVCKSTVANPYPLVDGPKCAYLANASNVELEFEGAIFTPDSSHNNSAIFNFDYVTNFKLHGATFLANPTGLPPGSFPGALSLYHLVDADISFKMSGNWGGSTRSPFAVFGDWWQRVVIHDVDTDQVVQGCFDTAFLRDVSFIRTRMLGGDDAGTTAGPSVFACFNVEDDITFRTDYPAAATFVNTAGVYIDESNDCSNYNACVFVRAGSRMVLRPRAHDNPAGGGLPNASGAGVLIYNETAACCSSAADPVKDVLVGGLLINNGSLGLGAGVVIDGTLTNAGEGPSNILIAGAVIDNNNATGVQTVGTHVSGLSIGVNTLVAGANQATAYDTNTISHLANAPNSPINGNCPLFDPGVATTQFCGPGTMFTTESQSFQIVGRRGLVSDFFVFTNVAPGAGHSYVVTLRVNSADSAITCTITHPAQFCRGAAGVVIDKEQPYDLKIVADNAAAAPTFVSWGANLATP